MLLSGCDDQLEDRTGRGERTSVESEILMVGKEEETRRSQEAMRGSMRSEGKP
jgi:hypothetical protein